MFDRYSVVDMFGPLIGKNWSSPEMIDGVSFRRADRTAASEISLPTLGAEEVRVRWTLPTVLTEDRIIATKVSLDGVATPLDWCVSGRFSTCWSDVALATERGLFKATLLSPSKQEAGGIPVHKVEVFALRAGAGGEIGRLRRELRAVRTELRRERSEMARQLQVRNSSIVWKMVAAVNSAARWFQEMKKRAVGGGRSAIIDVGSSHLAGDEIWEEPAWETLATTWRTLATDQILPDDALPLTLMTPDRAWDYGAISGTLKQAVLGGRILRLTCRAETGRVGVSLARTDGSALLSAEKAVAPEDGRAVLYFRTPMSGLSASILVRNYGDDGRAGRLLVGSVDSIAEDEFPHELVAQIAESKL